MQDSSVEVRTLLIFILGKVKKKSHQNTLVPPDQINQISPSLFLLKILLEIVLMWLKRALLFLRTPLKEHPLKTHPSKRAPSKNAPSKSAPSKNAPQNAASHSTSNIFWLILLFSASSYILHLPSFFLKVLKIHYGVEN